MDFKWVKIEVYTPEESLEEIRKALNDGGAGVIGNYDNCLSLYRVDGFWRPLEGADPYDGEVGKLCRGSELKLEVRCHVDNIQKTVDKLIEAHPYDEPVFNIVPLLNHLYINDLSGSHRNK